MKRLTDGKPLLDVIRRERFEKVHAAAAVSVRPKRW
jgi:hypothetical protein